MRFDEFKERVFDTALSLGCSTAELFLQDSEETSVKVLGGKVDGYDYSHSFGANLRVQVDGKDGYFYTESFDDPQTAVRKAMDNALFASPEDNPLNSGSVDIYDIPDADPTAEMVSPGDLISLALDAEKYALGFDSRVLRMDLAMYSVMRQTTLICNTLGLNSAYTSGALISALSPIVGQGEEMRDSIAFLSGAAARDSKLLARTAVQTALAKLGAKPVPGGDYKIIFQSKAAADMLSIFCSQFSADAAQKGLSPLAGKEGQMIASPAVNITDDPLNKYCPRPFDDEGTLSVVTPVIREGRFISFLHNLKTAKKAGVSSTSNGGRASLSSPVGVAPSNLIIEAGEASLEQLMQEMGDGLLICELAGQHAGAQPVTGDFSLMASGFVVKDGKIASPVDGITVAGTFSGLLENIEKVGSDTYFTLPVGRVFASPSLYVPRGIKVAGE